ncbi:hypothetical protein AMTRI_Chr03g139100 [Amborella trichopoda]
MVEGKTQAFFSCISFLRNGVFVEHPPRRTRREDPFVLPIEASLASQKRIESWNELLTSPDLIKLHSLSVMPELDSQPCVLYLDCTKNKVMFLYHFKEMLFHGTSMIHAPRWGSMVASRGVLCCLSRLTVAMQMWDFFYIVNLATGRRTSIADFPGSCVHHFRFYFDQVNDIMYAMFDSLSGQWRRPGNSVPDRSWASATVVSVRNTCYYMYKDNRNLVAFDMQREEGEIILVQPWLQGAKFGILEWDNRLALIESTEELRPKVSVLSEKEPCCLFGFGKILIMWGGSGFWRYDFRSGELISSSDYIDVEKCGSFIAYNPTLYSWEYN